MIISRERAPISTRLNAVDLYLVVCIFLVLSALLEYALILLLLKKRRKPKSPWTIEGGLMKVILLQKLFMMLQTQKPVTLLLKSFCKYVVSP